MVQPSKATLIAPHRSKAQCFGCKGYTQVARNYMRNNFWNYCKHTDHVFTLSSNALGVLLGGINNRIQVWSASGCPTSSSPLWQHRDGHILLHWHEFEFWTDLWEDSSLVATSVASAFASMGISCRSRLTALSTISSLPSSWFIEFGASDHMTP